MQLGDVGVGLALPGVPQGECGTRGRQAVPLRRKGLRPSGASLVALRPCRPSTLTEEAIGASHQEEKRTISENNSKGVWDDAIEPPRLAHLNFF
jgi:hypothetical protein